MKRLLLSMIVIACQFGCVTASVRDGVPEGKNFGAYDYHRVAFTENGQASDSSLEELVNTLQYPVELPST